MKGKFTTRTIIIAIIVLLVLAVAVTGTVMFLKDSGEAAAVGEMQNVAGSEQATQKGETENNGESKKEDINIEDETNQTSQENSTGVSNNRNEENASSNNQNNTNQEEPAPTTVEREKVISETTTLGWNNIGFNSGVNANSFEINYNNLEYKVEYYFEGVLEEDLIVTVGENSKGKIIDTYEDKIKVGYKLDKVENLPLTITENEDENLIKVLYAKDEEQTKNISYTVKYFIENEEQEADRKVIEETVWVNAKETMAFDSSLLNKEYTGYKQVSTKPETVGETVNNGDIIEVYYEKDEKQVKEISYTVKYFIENEEQEKDRVEKTKTVWVNAEDTMAFDSSLLNKEYTGYKQVRINPETIGDKVKTGTEVKVYYEKDLSKTKTLKYTVKYFLDDVEQKKDKVEKTKTVWVNAEDTMEFDATLLEKEYTGYIKIRTNPVTIGDKVKTGAEIKVYYATNLNATKDLTYTVRYYLDNVEQKEDTVKRTKSIWINSSEDIIDFDSRLLNKEYTGYKKVRTNPETIGDKVKTGTEVKVYYEKDLSKTKTLKYTVKYFLDDVEQKKDKVEKTKTVWVNAEDTMEFDATLLEKEYTGYKKTSTVPARIEATVNNGTEVKVYYQKDETQTKTLKYTVRYYLNNVEQEKDKVEKTKTVWINAEETIEFDATLLDKEYTGYRKVRTNPETIGTLVENGTVIKVYYLKPANIIVSKTSEVVDRTNAAEKGDKIKYTITAKNTGEEVGTVLIKDTDLKASINNGLIEIVSKTGYSGTNQELVDALAGNGISLTVDGGEEKQITYTVKILAKVGTTITNKVEVVSGGEVDEDKDETTNKVEKTATITEHTETIKGKNIVIVIDLSASMNDIIDGVSKLEAAKDAAQGFINKIFEKDPNGTSGTKLSIVTFNYGGNETSSGDTDTKYVGTHVFTDDNGNSIVTNATQATNMNSAIEDIELDSDLGTNMGAALIKAEQQLGVLRQGNDNEQVIIFLGDGDPSTGGDENKESAINNKATALKNAGVEIYTIGFGLNQKVYKWCPILANGNCDKEHTWFFIFRCHQEDVYEENAIRILRNMASGTEGVDKDKYAKSSTGAQNLIDTFNSISSSIAVNTDTTQSSNAKIELSSTIYADATHPITIKVNGTVDTTLTSLPTDASGKVIKEGTKYYLDLTKFGADSEVSITYFSK